MNTPGFFTVPHMVTVKHLALQLLVQHFTEPPFIFSGDFSSAGDPSEGSRASRVYQCPGTRGDMETVPTGEARRAVGVP